MAPAGESRRDHIQRQRSESGRRSLVVLPIHYPKEILTALDILSVELWGPPGPAVGDAAGRLQTYVCSVVRNALAFLASGKADAVDGVLFPHTCDALQGLSTLAPEFGGWGKQVFRFHHPRGAASRESARACVRAELRSLAAELEAWTGRRLDAERLAWAVALHDEIDRQRAAHLDHRARLPLDDIDLYAVLRRGEWLWPEDHLDELRALERRLAPGPAQTGIPILVSGYVPEPAGLLAALGAAGVYVAADDYAAVGRRVVRRAAGVGDPWAAVLDRYLSVPPCPTRAIEQQSRLAHLQELFARSRARGVLVHVQKFCEPELFDVPAICAAFAARRVPTLVVEGELERALSAQTETRLEAFAEMLRVEPEAA